MSQRTKRQHYVPQHYLKGFTSSNKKKFLFVYDKENGKIFPSSIRNIGHENYFYDVGEDQIIEKLFSTFESKFNIALQKLINNEDLNGLSTEDKELISNFIAVQMLRTKESRIENKQMLETIIEQIADRTPGLNGDYNYEIDGDDLRDLHVDLIFSLVPEISEILLKDMAWKLCLNKTDYPFWTSDHPCAKLNELEPEPYKSNMGLKCKGFQLHIPISSRLQLILMNKDIKLSDLDKLKTIKIDENTKKRLNQMSEMFNPKIVDLLPDLEIVGKERVKFENNLQVISSTQFIFSAGNDFRLAEDYLNENPQYGAQNRRRIISP